VEKLGHGCLFLGILLKWGPFSTGLVFGHTAGLFSKYFHQKADGYWDKQSVDEVQGLSTSGAVPDGVLSFDVAGRVGLALNVGCPVLLKPSAALHTFRHPEKDYSF